MRLLHLTASHCHSFCAGGNTGTAVVEPGRDEAKAQLQEALERVGRRLLLFCL